MQLTETVRPTVTRIVEKIAIQAPSVPTGTPEPENDPATAPTTQIKLTEKVKTPPADAKPPESSDGAPAVEAKPEGNTETHPVETKPEGEGEAAPKVEEPKPQTADAKKFAALARQEKELNRKRNELKAVNQRLQ